MNRLLQALGNSLAGLRHAARLDAAFRQEAAVFALSLPLAAFLAETAMTFVLLTGAVLLVLVTELINTAIEAVCDGVSRESMDEIRVAKDCASAAVLLAIVAAAAVWGVAAARHAGLIG